LTPDGGELALPTTEKEIKEEREKRVVECREARLKAANEVAKAGLSKAAMENPTASYEHCAMRVRTMTEKALMNRIKTIERACGKHCVVKMAVFKVRLERSDSKSNIETFSWPLRSSPSHTSPTHIINMFSARHFALRSAPRLTHRSLASRTRASGTLPNRPLRVSRGSSLLLPTPTRNQQQ